MGAEPVHGWEATTREVDDWIFDDITKTFVLDDEMLQFFEENNPYALEEIGRRLLEAAERGLWDADPEVLDGLKDAYLEMEGWIEERMGDVTEDMRGRVDRCGDSRGGRRVEGEDGCGFGVKHDCNVGFPN